LQAKQAGNMLAKGDRPLGDLQKAKWKPQDISDTKYFEHNQSCQQVQHFFLFWVKGDCTHQTLFQKKKPFSRKSDQLLQNLHDKRDQKKQAAVVCVSFWTWKLVQNAQQSVVCPAPAPSSLTPPPPYSLWNDHPKPTFQFDLRTSRFLRSRLYSCK
jgi:hypothetical protein